MAEAMLNGEAIVEDLLAFYPAAIRSSLRQDFIQVINFQRYLIRQKTAEIFRRYHCCDRLEQLNSIFARTAIAQIDIKFATKYDSALNQQIQQDLATLFSREQSWFVSQIQLALSCGNCAAMQALRTDVDQEINENLWKNQTI